MFENISRFAEAVATDLSRRAFLGRFGRSALACSAAVAALLSLPAVAHAHKQKPVTCCAGRCQRPGPNCTLVNNCHYCNPFAPCYDCWWNCNGTDVYTSCG
jgi:hypothetical protein